MARERQVQDDPQVLEGEDELPRQPSPPLDPYTPEPGPRPGERLAFRTMWWGVIVLVTLLAILIWVALR